MKKVLSIILMVILMIVVFSGCSKKIEFQTSDGKGQYNAVKDANTTSDEFSSDTMGDSNLTAGNSKVNSATGNSKVNSATGNSKTSSNSETASEEVGDEYVLPEDPETPLREHEISNYGIKSDYLRNYELDGRYVKMVQYSSLQQYNSFLDSLIKDGYTKYDQNQIGTNQFATFINQTTFVSVSFTTGNNKLKVISEPLGDLYPRSQDNKYTEKNIQSLFTGVKNENKPIYSGMGFIIRLSDGSFIIIDGGGGDYDSVDSNKFLKILKEQSPAGTEKPVIAAWIFTHCHDDHIGVFNAFSKDFHDKVIIKSFYYNFPPDDVIYKHAKFMFDNAYYSYKTMKKCIKDYYSDAKIIRPHSGEKYYIKNSVVEMLCSYEDFYPDSLTNGGVTDFNDTSLTFKINIGGQSMLITGDAHSKSENFLVRNYGDYLKSDILQLSHHGQNDLLELYKLVNPTYVLLPISHFDEKRMSFNEANKWIAGIKNKETDSISENVRQVIAFWNQNVTIPLPYNPKASEISSKLPDKNTTYHNYSIN